MATLLHVIATPNPSGVSVTRQLAARFLDGYRSVHPDDRVVTVDLACVELPPLDAPGVAALFAAGPAASGSGAVATRRQDLDRVVADFVAADRYLVTTPMWNFSAPYRLKHYIDLVIQPGRTVQIDERGARGLLAGRPAAVLISRGFDYGPGSGREAFDLLTPWLRTAMGFMGITDVRMVTLEGTQLPDVQARFARAAAAARDLGAAM